MKKIKLFASLIFTCILLLTGCSNNGKLIDELLLENGVKVTIDEVLLTKKYANFTSDDNTIFLIFRTTLENTADTKISVETMADSLKIGKETFESEILYRNQDDHPYFEEIDTDKSIKKLFISPIPASTELKKGSLIFYNEEDKKEIGTLSQDLSTLQTEELASTFEILENGFKQGSYRGVTINIEDFIEIAIPIL